MGVPGLVSGWLGWLLGGGTPSTKGAGVLGSVCISQDLIDNWCMPVVLGSLMGGDWF